MRVLVTGANGQLGFDCIRTLKERGYNDILGIDIDDLDLTDQDSVVDFIGKFKPDVIMHNAAFTAVDKAEEFKEQAYRVNVLATKYLAEVAQSINAKLIYISTDYVFPGDGNHFYDVDDNTSPKNEYGRTKLLGEEAARICEKLFIIRISWVFGVNGNNFVKTMLKLGETHKELSIVNDQIGSPTYTRDLSQLLCDLIETKKYGVFHATNEGVCSWYEFAKEIFKQTNMHVIVNPITTDEYLKTKLVQARRPLNSRLSKKSLDDAGFKRLPDWKDALKRYLKEINAI